MSKAKPTAARNVKSESVAEQNPPVTAEERYRMIAEAAYFRAEKRGFVGGDIAEDWIQAEAEIDRNLQAIEKGQGLTPTAKEIEQRVQAAVESDMALVSERVRAITFQVLSGGKLDKETLKQVMAAVVKGAQHGASRRSEHGAQALKEAIWSLDDALAVAAEATQLAIKEATSRTDEFSRQELKKTVKDLAELELLFIETIADAADSAVGFTQSTLHDLADHAGASGTAVGSRIKLALSEITHGVANTAHEQAEIGTQIMRNEGTLLSSLAAGMLKGIAERLQPASSDKSTPHSSAKDR